MTLGSGNLEMAVELPEGEDLNEWFAVNTIEFYNDSIKFLNISSLK
jgi:MOB kinase activator 1